MTSSGVRETVKREFVAVSGEFVGTFLFLFFAFFGTQVANSSGTGSSSGPDLQRLLFISLAFGFSLVVNAWVFFRISGGLFNPAVTLGTVLVGAVGPMRGVLLLFAQLIGSIAAAGVVKGLLPGHPELLFKVTLTQGMTVAQGLFLEMFLTAELVFTICMLAAEKHKATFVAPVGIGLSLFIAELAGVYYTGGALNPARAFGPCVVDRSFPGYHWIYWIGPFLGSLLAALFYKLMKALDYEEANPGQDKSLDPESSPGEPDRAESRRSGQRERPRSQRVSRESGRGEHRRSTQNDRPRSQRVTPQGTSPMRDQKGSVRREYQSGEPNLGQPMNRYQGTEGVSNGGGREMRDLHRRQYHGDAPQIDF